MRPRDCCNGDRGYNRGRRHGVIFSGAATPRINVDWRLVLLLSSAPYPTVDWDRPLEFQKKDGWDGSGTSVVSVWTLHWSIQVLSWFSGFQFPLSRFSLSWYKSESVMVDVISIRCQHLIHIWWSFKKKWFKGGSRNPVVCSRNPVVSGAYVYGLTWWFHSTLVCRSK